MISKILFEVKTPLNIIIRTTEEYWGYLIKIKHCNMRGKEFDVINTLSDPDIIRQSKIDKEVYLYYKTINNYLFCAVVRHENGTGFLITAYITDKVKEGEIIWTK